MLSAPPPPPAIPSLPSPLNTVPYVNKLPAQEVEKKRRHVRYPYNICVSLARISRVLHDAADTNPKSLHDAHVTVSAYTESLVSGKQSVCSSSSTSYSAAWIRRTHRDREEHYSSVCHRSVMTAPTSMVYKRVRRTFILFFVSVLVLVLEYNPAGSTL